MDKRDDTSIDMNAPTSSPVEVNLSPGAKAFVYQDPDQNTSTEQGFAPSTPIANGLLKIEQKHTVGDGKVSHIIDEDYKNWNGFNPVLIQAQTGLGKNYFISNYLIQYAISKNRPVYIFSNRAFLNLQQKKEVLQACGCGIWQSDEELQRATDFGLVHILTYQQVLSYFANCYTAFAAGATFEPTGYAIFDEAHFFLSDSGMNSHAFEIYMKLLTIFQKYVRVYMSATLEPFLSQINFYENYTYRNTNISHYQMTDTLDNTYCQEHLTLLKFPQNYDAYEVTFFANTQSIVPLLKNATRDNKWLYFMSDISRQKEMKKELGEIATYVNQANRGDNPVQWKKLVKGELATPVLLATSVIDNGINIKDSNLHNVVLECCDYVAFMQSLGRKRLDLGERVKVYVRCPDEAVVKNRLRQIDKLYKICEKFIRVGSMVLSDIWEDASDDVRALFWVNGAGQLQLNWFAMRQLEYQARFWNELLHGMQTMKLPSCAFPTLVLQWLGKNCEIEFPESECIAQLREKAAEVLINFTDKPVTGEGEEGRQERNTHRAELLKELEGMFGCHAIKSKKNSGKGAERADIKRFISDNSIPVIEESPVMSEPLGYRIHDTI